MKNLFLVLTVILSSSFSAFASNEVGNLGKIVCVQNSNIPAEISHGRVNAVLEQIGARDYKLTVTKTSVLTGSQLLLQSVVRAYQQDVVLRFRNINDRVMVMIFLDELNESSLSAPGLKVDMDCQFPNRLQ